MSTQKSFSEREIEEVLAGVVKPDAIPESSSEAIYDFLKKRFQERFHKLVYGYELPELGTSNPISLSFSVVLNKRVQLNVFADAGSDYGWSKEKDRDIKKFVIYFQDAGVHQGNAYGTPTVECRRSVIVKHISKLIPKIEEVYSFLEKVADDNREETIKGRIRDLQYNEQGNLRDIESEIKEIESFRKKYGGEEHGDLKHATADLLDKKYQEKHDEEEHLKTLPEFIDPRKVLKL